MESFQVIGFFLLMFLVYRTNRQRNDLLDLETRLDEAEYELSILFTDRA